MSGNQIAHSAEKDPRVKRLRDALAAWAKNDLQGANPGERNLWFSADQCRRVFTAAGIEIPEANFEAVALTFRRLPFYGGNYTLDAKRLLRDCPIPPAEGRS